MDHIVYLDSKAKEFENIKNGKKTMVIRGAMGRKPPHGRVGKGDILYFMENNGEGLVKGKAMVETAFHSEKLTPEESVVLVEQNKDKLLLSKPLEKRFAGKRFLVLLSIKDFEEIPPFRIDKSGFGNMDDWIPAGKIKEIRIKD